MNEVEKMFHNLPKHSISSEEKARMRNVLLTHMDSTPRQAQDRSPAEVPSPYVFFSSRFMRSHVFQTLALVVFVVCGGISAAAQGALPGDPLYAVKVHINEEVVGAFALSTQAKAEHESELAALRLAEAADLSASGRLTPETREEIAANLKHHVENVEKNINELESQKNIRGAVEVNSELESTLNAHEKLIIDLSADGSGSAASAIRRQLTTVSDRLTALERLVVDDNEVSTASEKQARNKSKQAETELELLKQKISDVEFSVEGEAVVEAQEKATSSLKYLSEGYASMYNGSYNKAFVNFQKSIRLSKEGKVILAVAKDIPKKEDGEGGSATSTSAVATTTATIEGEVTSPTTLSASGTTTPQTGSSTNNSLIESLEKRMEPARKSIINNFLKIGL